MAEMDIGYFGDERLKKTARVCLRVSANGRQFACASWETIGPKRSNFGVF
jgi:hypothetical protein